MFMQVKRLQWINCLHREGSKKRIIYIDYERPQIYQVSWQNARQILWDFLLIANIGPSSKFYASPSRRDQSQMSNLRKVSTESSLGTDLFFQKRIPQDKIRKNEVIRNDRLENVGQSQGSGIPGLKNLNFNTPLTKSSVYHTLPTMISQNFPNEQDLDESTYWKNQHRRDLEKVSSVFDVKSP